MFPESEIQIVRSSRNERSHLSSFLHILPSLTIISTSILLITIIIIDDESPRFEFLRIFVDTPIEVNSLKDRPYETTFMDLYTVGECIVFMGFSDERDCPWDSISIRTLEL